VRERRHVWHRRTAAAGDGPGEREGDGSEGGTVLFHILDCALFRSRTKAELYVEEESPLTALSNGPL
jgi:hypothetical protein